MVNVLFWVSFTVIQHTLTTWPMTPSWLPWWQGGSTTLRLPPWWKLHYSIYSLLLILIMTAEEESIPVTTGRKEGYTSHRSPVCRRANTENQTTVIWQNGPMDRPEELLASCTNTDSSPVFHFHYWHCTTQSNLLMRSAPPLPSLWPHTAGTRSLLWKNRSGAKMVRENNKKKLRMDSAKCVKLTDSCQGCRTMNSNTSNNQAWEPQEAAAASSSCGEVRKSPYVDGVISYVH